MDKVSAIKQYIADQVDRYNVSIIPLRFVNDKGIISGKVPAIANWSEYSHKTPDSDEVMGWYISPKHDISGVGLVCGEASNIGCIDIDSEDEELNKKLLACIPPEAVRIIGNPKRPGKFLFRLREFPNDPIRVRSTVLGNRDVDVLIDGKQIAMPPTFHTKDKIAYQWDSRFGIRQGEFPDVEMLPVLEPYIIEALNRVLEGESLTNIEATSPKGAINLDLSSIGEDDGRYNDMKKQIATLQRSKTPFSQAVKWLVEYDMTRNGDKNAVFLTKERTTASPHLNCARWYINQLCNNNRRKSLREIEIPTDFITVSEAINVQEFPGWDRPIMPEVLPKAPPFELEVIPPVWRQLVDDASSSNNVPAEACFMILATQLGAILGNKRWIRPKKNNTGYCEAHNIYTVYVSPSGTRKSQMLRIMSEPVRRLQKRIDAKYDKDMLKFQQQLELVDPQIQELEKRIKEESKNLLDDEGNKEYLESMQQKLENLRELTVPPARHQLIINSATPEKLLSIMENNPSGSMLVFNELSDLLNKFKKNGYESYKEMIMNAWDGYQSYTHQTKHNGDVRIENMCLGLYAAIQPSMFNQHIQEIYDGRNDDGFWQRPFIILNQEGNDPTAVDINFNHDQYFDSYEIFHKAYDIGEGDSVTFTEDARKLFMEFETRMSAMAQNEGNGAVSSYWAKNIGKLASMASIMQFLMNNGEMHQKVSLEALQRAMYIVERQINHVRNIFPSDSVLGLSEIIELMRSGIIPSATTMRELERKHKKYFGKTKHRNELMRELVKRNIIKTVKVGTSIEVHVSPYVF